MLGLKRGTVELLPHQVTWEKEAKKTIDVLKMVLKESAIDIQHIGSTAIHGIYAKPIIDIVVGVNALEDIEPYIPILEKNHIIFRKEDVEGQRLFVMGDFEKDIRTHHIHVVEWRSVAWNNYIYFRDYLNAFPEYAREYEHLKKQLAKTYPYQRNAYTQNKQILIERLLEQARCWRESED